MNVNRKLLKISEEEWAEKAREAQYNVSYLAREIGCSVKQLERFFVKRMRMNPHDWMTWLRTAGTIQGLRADLRVKEAADQAGYRTAAHYSREFKKVNGVTPTQVAYGAKVQSETAQAETARAGRAAIPACQSRTDNLIN